MVHIEMDYYSAIKMNQIISFEAMAGPRDCHTEWSQNNTLYINACMWNLEKWYKQSYLQREIETQT